MELLGEDPSWRDEAARNLGVRRVEANELFAQADIISLHVPLPKRPD